MKISINILCWNTRRTLVQTLKVLAEELGLIEHEIVVVDNGSCDGTADEDLSGAKYIRNGSNRGISHGKNQGIDASSGEYILLLDGDIIPVPGSIIKFMEFLDDNPEAGAIGFYSNKFSNQINRNGQKFHEERCDNLFEPREHCSHCIYYGLYRREIFDKVRFCTEGPFGEPGYGWEDFDFYDRMVRAGFAQWVAHINRPGGKYFHDINSSIRQMGNMKFRQTSVIRNQFYKERCHARQADTCPSG